METRTSPTTLTGDTCRRLERIIRDDLEHATVSSAMVLVEEGAAGLGAVIKIMRAEAEQERY